MLFQSKYYCIAKSAELIYSISKSLFNFQGIQMDDLILEFGSISNKNFTSLKDIGTLVDNSRYKTVSLKIKRGPNTFALNLIPRPWSGKGLLGCNVVPLEAVER